MNDFGFSNPRFLSRLETTGMLTSLLNEWKSWRDTENQVFGANDKRIAFQGIFKGLCELYAGKDKTSRDIRIEAYKTVEELFKNYAPFKEFDITKAIKHEQSRNATRKMPHVSGSNEKDTRGNK